MSKMPFANCHRPSGSSL